MPALDPAGSATAVVAVVVADADARAVVVLGGALDGEQAAASTEATRRQRALMRAF